jgi:hypothetical protein
MTDQPGESSPEQASVLRPPPLPPPGPPPMADFTPSAAEIQKFGELVKTGNRRYQEMVNSRVSLSPGERQQRTANFTAYYRTERADDEAYEAAAVATKAEGVPSAIYINADDLGKGEIRAHHNVNPTRSEGAPPLPEWLLGSSEILYQQYAAAGGGAPLPPLKTVQRRNVASGTGNVAMTCARALIGNDDDLFGRVLVPEGHREQKTVKFPGGRALTASLDDLFFSWLGTENGASAIWLVRDHGTDLGISGISRIVVNSLLNITIYFEI